MQLNPTLYPYDAPQLQYLLNIATPESAEEIQEESILADVKKIESRLAPNTLTAESIETICTLVRLIDKTTNEPLHVKRKLDVASLCVNKKLLNSIVLTTSKKIIKVFVSLHEKLDYEGAQRCSFKKIILIKFDEQGRVLDSKGAVRELIKLSVLLTGQPDNVLACNRRRVSLMQKLKDSPAFPKNYGFFTSATKEKMFIYQEKASFDLIDFGNDPTGLASLPLNNKLSLCKELVQALVDMKKAGVAHRDIKAENILIFLGENGEAHLKLTDFGLACRLDDAESLKALPGSLPWMAPEIVACTNSMGPVPKTGGETEIWPLGILLYYIAKHQPLSFQYNLYELVDTKASLSVAMHASSLLNKKNRTPEEDTILQCSLEHLAIENDDLENSNLIRVVAKYITTLNNHSQTLIKKWENNIAALPKPPEKITSIKDLALAILRPNPVERISIEDAEAFMSSSIVS